MSTGLQINSQTFSNSAGSTRTSTTWYNKYANVPELLYKAQQVFKLHNQLYLIISLLVNR